MAGLCFIGPAVLIVLAVAVLYDRYGTTAVAGDLRYVILPVILAIVAHAVWGLGRTAVNGWLTLACALAGFVGSLAGVDELVLVASLRWAPGSGRTDAVWAGRCAASSCSPSPLPLVGAATGDPVRLGVGLPQDRCRPVRQRRRAGRLPRGRPRRPARLADPAAAARRRRRRPGDRGPLFTTATFVGYQVAGLAGVAVATVAIFLPSFAFVAALGPVVAWLRRTPSARGALDGLVHGLVT